MKKFLFPLAAIVLSIVACNSTTQYTINGTVEGTQEGNVYLVKYSGRTADTLAQAPIKAGKFSIQGKVEIGRAHV